MPRNSDDAARSGGFAAFLAWIVGGTAVGLAEVHVVGSRPAMNFSGYSLLSVMVYYWVPSIVGGLLVWAGLSAASRFTGRTIRGLAWGSGLLAAGVTLAYAGYWVNYSISGPPHARPGIAANVLLVVVAVLVGVLVGKLMSAIERGPAGRGYRAIALFLVFAAPFAYMAWSWGNIDGGFDRKATADATDVGEESSPGRGGSGGSGPPNIVLITMDALRADHLTFNGYERNTSPYLESLASEGANFGRAFSQATITVRSMASLFTSLYPQMHGLMDAGLKLPETATTLPEALGRMGYTTAGFGAGNPSLLQTGGIIRGYDYFDDCRLIRGLLPQFILARLGILSKVMPDRHLTCPRAETVFEKAGAWLRLDPPEPYFLFIHLMDVHAPYLPPEPFDTKFGSGGAVTDEDARLNRRLLNLALRESALFFELVETGQFERMGELDLTVEDIGEENLSRLIDLYDGEIAYADSQLELFLEGLKDAGVLDKTLLVITADHGEGFLDHGRLFHSGDLLYDELMRVPLLMRLPGVIPPGTCVDAQVSLIDVMPTAVEAAESFGSKPPPELELKGRSLLDLLAGEEPGRTQREGGEVYCEGALVSCVRTEKWKYIDSQGHDTIELYDLEADPRENVNLIREMPEKALELSALLAGHFERVRLYREKHPRPTPLALDRETREKLRSLGYVK